MYAKGLCHICGVVASRTCKTCGRPTCDMHIKNGTCDSCRLGRR